MTEKQCIIQNTCVNPAQHGASGSFFSVANSQLDIIAAASEALGPVPSAQKGVFEKASQRERDLGLGETLDVESKTSSLHGMRFPKAVGTFCCRKKLNPSG